MERVGGSCDVVVSLGVEQIKLLDQVQKKKNITSLQLKYLKLHFELLLWWLGEM